MCTTRLVRVHIITTQKEKNSQEKRSYFPFKTFREKYIFVFAHNLGNKSEDIEKKIEKQNQLGT